MDLHKFESVIVFLVILLRASLVSGKVCTNGFLNSLSVENYDSRRLFPLLGQYGSSGAEQWIFPSLRFTCSGRLTKWTFRAAYAQAGSSQCRINIGTWRLDRSRFSTVYRRLSTTEEARITSDGLVFTYELASSVQFQSGDIVGVELSSYTCSIFGGFGNILSLDISGTGSTSQSYRQLGTGSRFRVSSQDPFTNLVPFIQPVIETATLEEPTIGDTIFTALNSTEHTTTVTGPSTSSQAHEDMRITTRSERFSTTTEGSSGLVNTSEPQDKKILIIHIVAGVGIGTIVLIGIVVTCISLVGIMKCMQARSTKGRSDDIEEPQVVISSSNGTLLQENTAYTKSMNSWSTDTTCSDYETMSTEESIRRNTEHIQVVSSNSNGTLLQENAAYRKLMNSWSADTTGYETLSTDEGRNFDSEQPQNTSNSDDKVVGYEIMSTKEQSKPDSTQPQDSSDSNGIVVQENTAYNKSTNSRDIVGYETTSTVQDRDTNINQCSNSSGIVIHKNTAYKKSTNSWDTVTGYETMDEIVEQVMQLNQAYGFQGESQEGTDSINSGDYETMTGDLAYDYGSQAHRGMDKKSTLAMAETVTYDVLIQQQKTNPEDGEHSYDYVI